MLYRYVSITSSGTRITGKVEARDADEAKRFVSDAGEYLIELNEASRRNWLSFERDRADVSLETASVFAIELATLVEAGAPLRKALEIQSDGNSKVSRLAALCIKQLDNGGSLSSALRQAGGSAGLLAEFAAAGETGAGLGPMLETGGEFLRARAEAMARIRSAMSYPFFIGLLSVIALIVVMVYVAPALAPAIDEAEGAGLILKLADAGNWIQANGSLLLLGGAASLAGLFLILRGQRTKERLNALGWSLPLIGPIAKNLDVGQACAVMSALLKSGRSLENALQFAGAASSPRIAKSFADISDRLRDGQIASLAFAEDTALPGEVRRLAALGESSSAFPEAMQQAGRICHDRAMRQLERVSALAGPVLVIGMGGMIAGLMLTVLGSLSTIGGSAL